MTYKLNELSVVGYAEHLSTRLAPARVPPVFLLPGVEKRFLVPPFKIDGDAVLGGHEISEAELNSLIATDRVTPLPNPISRARTGHGLWVDSRLSVHYQPYADVDSRLRQIADSNYGLAKRLLYDRKRLKAHDALDTTLRAVEAHQQGWVLRALLYKLEDDQRMLRDIREQWPKLFPGQDLEAQVSEALLELKKHRRSLLPPHARAKGTGSLAKRSRATIKQAQKDAQAKRPSLSMKRTAMRRATATP
jgi:hypothetical protein